MAIREGRHFKTAEAKRHTVSDLIDRYTRDVLPNKGAKDRIMQPAQLERWRAELGHLLLSDLTPAAIVEVRDKLAKDIIVRGTMRSPGSVARYLAVLSHALTVAVNEWGWLEDSPMRKVNKPKLPGGRIRFLSDEEREALLFACRESTSEFLYPAVVLALATGMRRGEVLGLYWREPETPLVRWFRLGSDASRPSPNYSPPDQERRTAVDPSSWFRRGDPAEARQGPLAEY